MIKQFLRRLQRWKAAALSPMGFIMIIASALLFELCLMPMAWTTGWVYHLSSEWYFRMLDELRKNVNTSFAPAVISGAILIAGYLVNRNRDKIPDKMEGADKNVTRNPVSAKQTKDLRDGRKL
ncbi:hypothetical protein [Acidaminococcus timonensis]|uniref:hypothetical protein n=1 Tax=Acidaminococcus timonensis TaxID=1871002 RepID=UPI0008D9A699|nr:hypothetical protein [Acidaminococcus timonensis]